MLKISKQTLTAAVVIAAASAPSTAFARPDFEPSQAPARSASVNPTQLHRAKPSALRAGDREAAREHTRSSSPVRSLNLRVLRITPRLPHRAASSGTTPGSAPQECSGSSEPRARAPSSHAAAASTGPPPSETTEP